MRAALWLLTLFAIAVATALFAGNNQGVITVFWPPYRVDLSLNLVVLLTVLAFAILHLALRALAALFELPQQARRWRAQQRERATHAAVFDSLGHLLAGRYVRARKAAQTALAREKALVNSGEHLGHAVQLRALAHWLAAESTQALQDSAHRDQHLREALDLTRGLGSASVQELHDGLQLRAARWALDEREVQTALRWLDNLPQGVQRRTAALRIKLKAARLAQRSTEALDTARLLAKHRAFSPEAAQSLVRALVLDQLGHGHDVGAVQRLWADLDEAERRMPDLALQAGERLQALGGDRLQVRSWLQPVWEHSLRTPGGLDDGLQARLLLLLQSTVQTGDESGPVLRGADHDWLAHLERALQQAPRDPSLLYLAGMTCWHLQLWGKAQQLLGAASTALTHPALQASAWRTLAQLAEQRGDADAAALAWRQAALTL